MIVLSCTDTVKKQTDRFSRIEGRYDTQLMALLCSLKINYPIRTLVYCINFKDHKVDKMRKLFDFACFELIKEPCSPTQATRFKIDTCTWALEDLPENEVVTWLDTDTLVRKDLSELESSVNNIKIKVRDTNDLRIKVNAGVFCLRKNELVMNFMKEWKRFAMLWDDWFSEQKSFWTASQHLNIKLEELTPIYNNMWGDLGNAWNNDSYIWHCKSGHDQKEWIAETQKYLSLNNLTLDNLWN